MSALGGLVNPANKAIFQQRFSIPSTFETPSDPPLPRDADALAARAPATERWRNFGSLILIIFR